MVVRRQRSEWFGHDIIRRDETQNIRAVGETKMDGSALEEDRSFCQKTVSERTWQHGASMRNGPLTENDGNVSARPATPHRKTHGKRCETCCPLTLSLNRFCLSYFLLAILSHLLRSSFGFSPCVSTTLVHCVWFMFAQAYRVLFHTASTFHSRSSQLFGWLSCLRNVTRLGNFV